ncbi:uncharacterized protein LOC126900242 [Daktulosphaira vitifoliae]|uniref:uncharacterized protein LOC126900242 n=1 Tax=Daktulosphaira vitifoliae TaxID=58002 RepID=UPI0021AA1CF0|nr:uncharacterized protein LOC126900242 [Daktulosphaira vitifoliae]
MYRRTVFVSVIVLAVVVSATIQQDESLLDRVLDKCSFGEGAMRCLKSNVLEYLEGRSGRANEIDPVNLDEELVKATTKYIEQQVYEVNVPGSSAKIVVRPGRDMDDGAMDIVQPTATTTTTARADMEMGMMQDKMLMPLLMLLKMKMKMLTPIMMALISMKATKALILSKLAVILVLGFIVKDFLKKSGGLPMLHLPLGLSPAEPSSTATPMYGPPQSSGYESASSWEPTGYSSGSSSSYPSSSSYSSGGSGYSSGNSGYSSGNSGYSSGSSGYSSGHSTDSAQSLAYSSYLPSSSGSSSSSTASKYSN